MDLFERVSSLDDTQWRELVLSSAEGGTELPGVPPFEVQKRFNARTSTRDNLDEGHQAYRIIMDALAKLQRPLQPSSLVLDVGCGWGSVARYFLHDVRLDGLHGVDVSEVGIAACGDAFGSDTFRVIGPWPPTDLPADTFDLVYSISLFSHLPEDMHLAWVQEIARILRAGGVFVATTLGRQAIGNAARRREQGTAVEPWEKAITEAWGDPTAVSDQYNSGKFVFFPKPKETYGMTLIPEGYVRANWGRWFDIHGFTDEPSVFPQSVIVAQKPGRSTLGRLRQRLSAVMGQERRGMSRD